MASLSDETKVRVRYHLAYPLVESGAHIEMQGVILTVVDATNRLEYAMDHIRSGSEYVVLKLLSHLDAIEEKMTKGALCRLQTSSIDEIDMNPDELSELEKQYINWVGRLADFFSCVIYPNSYLSKMRMKGMSGNRVRHST